MLAAIIRSSIRHRGRVLALATVLIAYGVYSLFRVELELFPEFSPKQVIIQTESPGLSAEQVETLVTRPIENTLAGTIDLQSMRSESMQGLSMVRVVFEAPTELFKARQWINERLQGAISKLPRGIGPPVVVPLSSTSVRTLGVRSDKIGMMALRDLVQRSVVPRLLSVPGVADVNVYGGDVRQLQIRIKPNRLRRYKIGINDVIDAAKQVASVRGAGFIENDNQRIILYTSGLPVSPIQLSKVVLNRQQDGNLTLGDVANIKVAPQPPMGAAAVDGRPAIVMTVIGQYGANTLTVSKHLQEVLSSLRGTLSDRGVELHPDLFVPADYIERSIGNLTGHMVAGAVCVILVLFLFDFRAAAIAVLVIPLSLLGALVVLMVARVNLNIMVIGGLAIALGKVVDDAIIDTETLYRRLRENALLSEPLPLTQVIFDASREVRKSAVYASFIAVLVFMPLLTLGGIAGRMFTPLATSYILAIVVSLGVALTVTPALCFLLFTKARLRAHDAPLMAWLKPRYAKLLEGLSATPLTPLLMSLVVCFGVLSALPSLGGRFLTELREGHFIVHSAGLPGTSLQESLRIGAQISKAFLGISGVRSVSQQAGRSGQGADTHGSHTSEFEIALEPLSGAQQQRVLEQLRDTLERFPGIVFDVNTFLSERVDEALSGYNAPVVVNIYGHDLDVLGQQAQAMALLMRGLPHAADVQMRPLPTTPLMNIHLQLDKLAHWGLRPAQVTESIQVAYEGLKVGKVQRGNRLYDVTVILPGDERRNLQQIGKLPIKTLDGKIVHLKQVAKIRQVAGHYNILHRGAQRVQTVTCDVVDIDPQTFIATLKDKVRQELSLDAHSSIEYTGSAMEQAQAKEQLLVHSLWTGAGVLMLIYFALGSLRHTLLVLVNLPFSLVGGVIALVISGGTLSVGVMVGFVTLFGITVRNNIMLLSRYRQLVDLEGQPWNAATAIQGAQDRITSSLMTALVTALAMLPIALNSDDPGREIIGPMATVIIGGLVSSTLLNLLLMPTIMLRYGRFTATPAQLAR